MSRCDMVYLGVEANFETKTVKPLGIDVIWLNNKLNDTLFIFRIKKGVSRTKV